MVVVASSGDPSPPPARNTSAVSGSPPVRYSERWWPSAGVWTSLVVISLLAAATVVPIGWPWPLITSTGAAVGVTAAVLRTCHTLRVTDTALTVGDRCLPRRRIVAATPLSDHDRRKAMGPLLDARSPLAVRGWIPTAVLVECTLDTEAEHTGETEDCVDTEHRTLAPPWIISTRYPQALCDALEVPYGTLPSQPTVATGTTTAENLIDLRTPPTDPPDPAQ